tara:strand:+ start:5449 stop:6450 length:1002 start_codon:yes stop_codon:yes gene_type:complete
MDLNKIISKARPNVKESTIKMYERNLNKLKKLFEADDWDFLDDPKKIHEMLKDKHYSTIRNYYNSIIILLMALNSDKKKDKLIEEYSDLRDELNKQYEDENAKGIISDKQKGNFVPLKEVEDMIETIGKEISTKKIKKKEDLTQKDKALLQVYVLLNIHIRLPMRNDMAGIEAIMKSRYNKLTDKEKEENNYLVVQKSNMWFVLNQYKTQKKYKEKKIDIPKDLEKILRLFIRINGMGMLFKSSTGKPLSRNALTQLLTKTSKKYMDKSISTTMLRKIVLSEKFQDVKEEMEDMAHITGHSVDTMSKVYVKKGQDKSSKKEKDKDKTDKSNKD